MAGEARQDGLVGDNVIAAQDEGFGVRTIGVNSLRLRVKHPHPVDAHPQVLTDLLA
jgi:hypothetical protein